MFSGPFSGPLAGNSESILVFIGILTRDNDVSKFLLFVFGNENGINLLYRFPLSLRAIKEDAEFSEFLVFDELYHVNTNDLNSIIPICQNQIFTIN